MEEKPKSKLAAGFDKLIFKKLVAAITGFVPAYLVYKPLDSFANHYAQRTKITEGCFYLLRESVGTLLHDMGLLFACGSLFCLTAIAVERIWDGKKLVKGNEWWKLASLGFGWIVTLIFILVSGRNYLCLKNNEIVDQSIFGKRGIYEWNDVSYMQTDCRFSSGKGGSRYQIVLELVMKQGQMIEAWSDDLKTLGYTRKRAYDLGKILSVSKSKKIPIIRGNLNGACREKFTDFGLIGAAQIYDEPEIWEVVKEVFVGKANI